MSAPEVSIIMLCHNGWKDITEPGIRSILSKTEGVGYELIVVDNGSSDETAKQLRLIASKDSRLVPLLLKENLGFSGGNNQAFKIAKGKYIIFINNDVLAHNKAWLKTLLDEKKKNPNAIVGQQLITVNTWSSYRNMIYPYLGGWCVLASKEDFNKIVTRWAGPWGNDFGKGFFEDVWMSIQFKDLGYELVEKEAGLEHLGSKTVSKLDPDEMTRYAQKVYKHFHIMREKCGKKLRIVFYYPFNRRFNEEDYEGSLGVGGSEAALIQLSRELANMGHVVDIYNDCSKTGNFKGVNWNHISDFSPDDYCDVFILFRSAHPALHTVFAKTKIFFSCDQYTNGNWLVDVFPYVDRIIAISPFHKKYMVDKKGADPDKIVVMDLGVSHTDYVSKNDKIRDRLIFCSVPERGLRYMPEAFNKIRTQVPGATLVVTSDYTLWGAKALNEGFKNELAGYSGVTFLGKVPRHELVRLQNEAEVMAYPCNYDENFCISAAECMAAGAVPVTTRQGSLPTTVGDCGVIINKVETDDGFVSDFVREVVSLLKDRERLDMLAEKGRERAKTDFYWSKLVLKYIVLFNKLLEGKEELSMTKCNVCNKEFDTAFEMFKHRNKDHPLIEKLNTAPDAIVYRIKTKRSVTVSLNKYYWEGKDIEVPKEMAGEVIRIINECYGADVIDRMSMGL